MSRIIVLLMIVACAITPAHAQKVYRIGIVSPLTSSPEPPTVREFRKGLRDLGYVEGKSVIVEARFTEGHPERFPDLIAGLLKKKVDVLVIGSSIGAREAMKATSTVPIVFAGVADAATTGLAANLARPGGNVTGTTFGVAGAAMAGKWLELLKEAVPRMTHVAVLFNAADVQSGESVRQVHLAARDLKVRVDQFDADSDESLDKAFAAIGASGAQGLVVTATAYFGGNQEKIVRLVREKRIPAIYFFSLFPDIGGLMSYGGSTQDSYRRAALQVHRILKGEKPGDLPIDQATRFEFVVNLKTAKDLGLAIPKPLLMRADRIIE